LRSKSQFLLHGPGCFGACHEGGCQIAGEGNAFIQDNADAVIAVRILSLNQNKIRFLGTAQA